MGNIEDAARDGYVFVLSVDGVHCPINEPHPWSSKWSSHKLGGHAAVNYELGVFINEDRLGWVNGPFPAGKCPDLAVFRIGLKEALSPGTKIIGDRGYRGEPDFISTANGLDPRELAEFKERVLSRHESFNQRIKNYKCLSERFRHNLELHKTCFEAVCAITMYEIESGATSLLDPYP